MASEMKDTENEEVSDYELETLGGSDKVNKPQNMKPGAIKLRNWLNKTLRIEMTDGRVLIGIFLCTDRDANVILGSCSEFLPPDDEGANEDPRMLGLVMVPGRHIVSVHIDLNEHYTPSLTEPLSTNIDEETDDVV